MSIQAKMSSLVTIPALFIAFSGPAAAGTPDPGILAPDSGEVVYQNTLELRGIDSAAQDNDARWAVRDGTCAGGIGTVAGNVDGFSDAFIWDSGHFSASVDISMLPAGEYCFVLNTRQGPEEGSRLTRNFFVVADFAKVGGTIGMGGLGRGNSPTHALDGVVGDAGPGVGIVGSITVNYRELGEVRTYEAASLSFRSAPGIGASGDMAVATIGTTGGATILVLDRDASTDPGWPDFPRGAIIVRKDGTPSINDYEIDNSEGSRGADSWVPMERGNNHTGTR